MLSKIWNFGCLICYISLKSNKCIFSFFFQCLWHSKHHLAIKIIGCLSVRACSLLYSSTEISYMFHEWRQKSYVLCLYAKSLIYGILSKSVKRINIQAFSIYTFIIALLQAIHEYDQKINEWTRLKHAFSCNNKWMIFMRCIKIFLKQISYLDANSIIKLD